MVFRSFASNVWVLLPSEIGVLNVVVDTDRVYNLGTFTINGKIVKFVQNQ